MAGVGVLYREALMDAFPAVEQGVRGLGNRLRGRQRGSLYQACPLPHTPADSVTQSVTLVG